MMKRLAALAVAGVLMVACGETTTTSSSLAPTAATKFTAVPVDKACDGTGQSNCSLPTPVVLTTINGLEVTVNWTAVEGADHYTVKCDVAPGAGLSCGSGNGDNTGTSQVYNVSAPGIYHFSVKAHGHSGQHGNASGQNSFTGWAQNNGDIDICVGDCSPTPPDRHVHVDVVCNPKTTVYNGAAQELCTATVTGSAGFSQSLTVAYTDNQNVGTATGTATFAGDADHDGGTDSDTFEITPMAVTITGGSYSGAYDGQAHAVSACAVSTNYDSLTCDNAPASVGPNAGSGSVVPSQSGSGWGNYTSTGVNGSWSISKVMLTATAYTGPRTFGQANPTLCDVTGEVNSEVFTCTSSSSANALTPAPSGPYVTTAAMDGTAWSTNYDVTYVNGALNVVRYDLSNCYIAPIYSVMPTTKSYQKKGSVLPIKCVIRDVFGAIVSNATGTVTIKDRGTNALPAITGGFKFTSGTPALYMNQQDTSNPYYVVNHMYDADTQWNDGSTTKGYFGIGK